MVIEVTFDVTDVYISTTVSPVYVNVSFEAPSGGGGTEWGDITGTLSDQTDLQTALEGKFDDPTGTSLQYIDGTGALQTFPLTLPVLQEVRNQTGATLDAGTVVYINGATGNKPTVTKAIATGDATSAQTLGMVSASIANNGTGYVVVIGTCSGLDTSAFTEGQQLYLSYTTAGAVTTTKPYAPYHLVYIGIVTRAHPTLGTVEVRVQNGYELDEIHDVDALNPNNNDGLFYNSSTSLWEHKQISTALGYTPANAATTLTINGVTYDLSTSRTWTISAGISGSGASGQVAYWDGTTSQAGSANLVWDNSTGRLSILSGVDNLLNLTPTSSGNAIVVNNNGYIKWENSSLDTYIRGINGFFILNNSFGTQVAFPFGSMSYVNTGQNFAIGKSTDSGERLQVQGTTLLNGNVTFSSATGMFWDATNSRLGIGTNVPATSAEIATSGARLRFNQTVGGVIFHGIEFATSGTIYASLLGNQSTGEIRLSAVASYFPTFYASGSEGMRLTTNRNLILQNGGTFTDSGERLQVTGTALLNGFTKVRGTTNNDTTSIFRVEQQNTNGRFVVSANGQVLITGDAFASTENFVTITRNNFNPTSGTATHTSLFISPTINQTGGANGITRGLYVNPTLTAAADFRAIETSAGNVLFGSNFFWDNTNGRLGIGTNAPSTTLDIRGKARIQASGNCELDFVDGANSMRVAMGSTQGFIGTLSSHPFGFFTAATERARISTNGNLLIGSTTDSGERLQVTGTMKVTDTLTVSTGSTKGINFAGTRFSEADNQTTYTQVLVQPNSGNKAAVFLFAPSGTSTSSAMEFYHSSSLSFTQRFVFKNTNGLLQIGADGASLPAALMSNNVNHLYMFGNGNIAIQNGGTFTDIASSKLSINSTTQGFLPPRMTTTQKNAISSPAAGLVVYDTTLAKLCVYTTAWETITSV